MTTQSFGSRARLVFALTLLACVFPGAAALAERPSAMKLFPEESIVFVRASNGKELGEKIRETSLGQMLADPQLQPFVEALTGKLGAAYTEKAESIMGISWEDLKNLPQGEVAFAVVARPERMPALLLLVDQGEEPSVADRLVERALTFAEDRGSDFSTEKIGDVEVTIVRDANRENRMVGVFEREHTIVAATDENVLRSVLHHWDRPSEATAANAAASAAEAAPAEEESPSDTEKPEADAAEESTFVPSRSLAQNQRFVTMVRECRRPQDPPPHLLFYVDPIELFRGVGRREPGAALVMGLLPALGLDGLSAVGGAITYSTDEYESLAHFHVLLENPRSGVMLLPAFQAGDTTPQPFVPLSTESTITWNWNMRAFYDRVIALVDPFRYEGSVDMFVKENMSDKLGIDARTQIIDNLKGRYTWMVGFERPSHLAGRQQILACELADEAAAQESLKAVVEKWRELLEERTFGKATYYAFKMPEPPQQAGELQELQEDFARPTPFVAILDGYLFIGSSIKGFEACVAARDGTAERLADSSDAMRAATVLGRETVGITPVMLLVNRPVETYRQWYDLLTSEKTRAMLDTAKENNPVLTALAEALDENKLPPFEVFEPYLAPAGAILYDTDTGYHAISFSLRNETAQKPAASK